MYGINGTDIGADAAFFAQVIQDNRHIVNHTHHFRRAGFDADFTAVALENIYFRDHGFSPIFLSLQAHAHSETIQKR